MELSYALESERKSLIEEIHSAFLGVSRKGGVSWSQAEALDDCLSQDEIDAAASKDKDTCWQQLIESDVLYPCASNWSFLDAIGFKYYLPAMMIRCLTGQYDGCFEFHLTLPTNDLRSYVLGQWSKLETRQIACIKRFLLWMAAEEQYQSPARYPSDWKRAYDKHWSKL